MVYSPDFSLSSLDGGLGTRLGSCKSGVEEICIEVYCSGSGLPGYQGHEGHTMWFYKSIKNDQTTRLFFAVVWKPKWKQNGAQT